MQDGLFGSDGYVYCIEEDSVAAFNLDTGDMLFYYRVNKKYGTIVFSEVSPVLFPSGALVLATWENYLLVLDALQGNLVWSYAGKISSLFPITTDNRSLYFVSGNQVVGADIYTGAVTSITSFGVESLFGYGLSPGVDGTTIAAANGYVVYVATAPLYESPAGPNPHFQRISLTTSTSLEPSPTLQPEPETATDKASKAWIFGVAGAASVITIVAVVAVVKCIRSRTARHATAAADDDSRLLDTPVGRYSEAL